MKKVFTILIIFIFMICLTGCTKESKYIKKISYDGFKQKIANKETFVLYVGNKDCSHCAAYKPILTKVCENYKITIYHLDNSKLSEKQYTEFKKIINISGTPTVAFITNGEEESSINRISGESSEEDTIEVFKINGYIK